MSRCEYRTWCEFSTQKCYDKSLSIKDECREYEINKFLDYLKFGRKVSDETKERHWFVREYDKNERAVT